MIKKIKDDLNMLWDEVAYNSIAKRNIDSKKWKLEEKVLEDNRKWIVLPVFWSIF